MNNGPAPESVPHARRDPVTARYAPKASLTEGDRRNLDRVRILQRLFGLSVSQISACGGVSRPYLSRALSGSLVPSPAFWRRLESGLGTLVDRRDSQFFAIPATDCDGAVAEVLEGRDAESRGSHP